MSIDRTRPAGTPETEAARRKAGLLLVIVSSFFFSTAGLWARGISAGAWDIVFWRGLIGSGFMVAYVAWRGTLAHEFLHMGWSGWAIAVIGGTSTAAYMFAFKLTTIANVSMIYAASPLLAGLVAWVWFRERLTGRMLLGCVAALGGVVLIVWGSLGSFNVRGDLLALVMAATMALVMAIYRRHPETPAASPLTVSSLLLLPVAWAFGDPLHVPLSDFPALVGFGLVFAIGAVMLSEGARRLPAAETGLLSSLETPLAPVIAWALLGEWPTNAAIVGGLIIMAAVIWTQIER